MSTGKATSTAACKVRHGVQALPSKAWSRNLKPHLLRTYSQPAPKPVASAAPTAPVAMNASDEEVAAAMIEVVVEHTGYPAEFIEMDQDLEGELGIDTVKQAEIMAALRDRFSLPVDEDFVLSDHPTLNHMLAYLHACKVALRLQQPKQPWTIRSGSRARSCDNGRGHAWHLRHLPQPQHQPLPFPRPMQVTSWTPWWRSSWSTPAIRLTSRDGPRPRG